ncbi:MAG: diguanylate cyclase [Marinomonas sp.]|uniref:diguanylate cyclase n=1 Tax=Marinomonas sp. TaxID=1904862 RepID=UPI003C796133
MTSLKTLQKRKNRSVLYISAIILCIDLVFIAFNYYTSQKTLNSTLFQRAQTHQNEFNLTLDMTYRNMLQLSTYISNNDELNQLFLAGKKAVEKDGIESESVAVLRQKLLDKVKVPWDLTTDKFHVRQLHYQLGPGSLSYLRVHRPSKFGDRMDNTRFTIVDTNEEKTERIGFETGRIYSGLRGVSPIWTIDPETNQKTYVGAVEAGTSFEQILPLFSKAFKVNVATYLTKEHVQSTMWQSYIDEHFKGQSDSEYYLEATSSEEAKTLLDQTPINESFIKNSVTTIEQGDQYFSSYYFPLFDYRGTKDSRLPPVGFILIWEDVTPMIVAFRHSFIMNILFFALAFLIIEVFLLWILGREKKLSIAEREAIIDGLTGLYNRRYYDALIKKEKAHALKTNRPLSLIICDIDYFKRFNDTYGHSEGDKILKQVAMTIRKMTENYGGVAARYGGEEFTIVLPSTDITNAITIADHIRNAVYTLKIPHEASLIEPYLTLSLGISCTHNLPAEQSLINIADANLYQAKEHGRNRVEPSVE